MPHFIILLVFLLLAAPGWGQIAPNWAATYNGPASGTESDPQIVVDAQGNTYVAATEQGVNTGQDWVILKYSAAGVLQFVRHWNNTAVNGNDTPTGIALDSQGNVLIVGITWNDVNINGTGGTEWDIQMLKISPLGAALWQRRWDGPIHFADQAFRVRVDSADNVIVMGWSESRSTNPLFPNYLNNDFLTLKYSPAGALLWSRTYNGPDQMADGGNDMVVDAAGNIYVTGISKRWSGGAIIDATTIKYSPAGALLWVARLPGRPDMADNANYPWRIRVDAVGNVYVGGWDQVTDPPRDVMLLKYNPNGTLAWKRNWIRPLADVLYDMALDSKGNPILAISTEPSPGKGFPDSDAALVKFDTAGNLLWEQTYSGPADLWDGDNVITVDAADNVYVGLQSASITYDYTLLKYSPAGALQWVWKYDSPQHKDDMVNQMAMAFGPDGILRMGGTTSVPGQQWDILTLAVDVARVQPVAVPNLVSMTFAPATVIGGQTAVGTVKLDAPAPVGGVSMKVVSSDASIAWMPGWLDIPAGATSGSFAVNTAPNQAPTAVSVLATYNFKTIFGTLNVGSGATAPTLAGLTISPNPVTGGTSTTGRVTLSAAAPAGGAVVSLASNNAAAACPASVTVPAGSTGASFTVTTKSVTTATSVTISAAYAGIGKAALLTVNAPSATPPPPSDTVGVGRAEYTASKQELRVEATSTSATATLKVYATATNALIGTLANNGGGKYSGTLKIGTNPSNITVKSSLGGSATKAVTLK